MFTDSLWEEWLSHELLNYEITTGKKKYIKKGYTHFDHRFWLPSQKGDLKKVLANGLKVFNRTNKKMQWYAFTPFLKLLLKTPRYRYQEEEGHYDLESKIRPICFASHFDSLIFGFYSFGLNKKYQEYINANSFEECVLAYRSDTGKCNIQYSKEVFDQIKAFNIVHGSCTAIALDIKGYFDNINHNILKEKWIKVWGTKLPDDQYQLFKNLTRYSYVNKINLYKKYNINENELRKKKKFPSTLAELIPGHTIQAKYDQLKMDKLIIQNKVSEKKPIPVGVPQGSAMSALLSNIYLIDYDKRLMELSKLKGFIYRRYCDDIIIICQTPMAKELKDFAIKEVKEKYHLVIQKEKAEIIDFLSDSHNIIRSFRRKKEIPDQTITPTVQNEKVLYKNLQYLGFEFNGADTFIRSSSVSRYFRKMKSRLDKTVKMAYGAKSKGEKIYRFQIYEKYSHFGTQNFISYARKAASKQYKTRKNEWKEGHNSPSIRKQLNKHMQVMESALTAKNKRQFNLKKTSNKKIFLKKG